MSLTLQINFNQNCGFGILREFKPGLFMGEGSYLDAFQDENQLTKFEDLKNRIEEILYGQKCVLHRYELSFDKKAKKALNDEQINFLESEIRLNNLISSIASEFEK